MLEKIKKFFKRNVRKVGAAVVGAFATSLCAVSAFAADATEEGSSNMASVVNTAGTLLQEEFTSMVNSLVPILIAIALVGLGMYAIIFLFKTAKNLFAKAAG